MTTKAQTEARAIVLATTNVDALIDEIDNDCIGCNDGTGALGGRGIAMITAIATA